jgi:hypothetical protein
MKLLLPLGPVSASARRKNLNVPTYDDSSSSSSSGASSNGADSPLSTPDTPIEDLPNVTSCEPTRTVVYIDILEPHIDPASIPLDWSADYYNALTEDAEANVVRTSCYPRPIHCIDPTVTFAAPASVSAQSSYTVYLGDKKVFQEITELTACGMAPGNDKCLFSTSLVPGYWSTIVASDGMLTLYSPQNHLVFSTVPFFHIDPCQYSIHQEVYRDDRPTPSTSFSATYKFKYASLHTGMSTPHLLSSALSDNGYDSSAEPLSPQSPLASIPVCSEALFTMPPHEPPFDEMYETFLALSDVDRSWNNSPSQLSVVDFSGSTKSSTNSANANMCPWGYPAGTSQSGSKDLDSLGPITNGLPASFSPLLGDYSVCGIP